VYVCVCVTWKKAYACLNICMQLRIIPDTFQRGASFLTLALAMAKRRADAIIPNFGGFRFFLASGVRHAASAMHDSLCVCV